MLANGTLFGGNATQGRTGPAYRPKASVGMSAGDDSKLVPVKGCAQIMVQGKLIHADCTPQ